jgi:hypothetical protein
MKLYARVSLFATALILAVAVQGCPPPPPPNPPPAPTNDGGVALPGCPAACENMRRLGCDIGKPTARGASCEDVCANAQANGIDFRTSCLASAASCEAAESC